MLDHRRTVRWRVCVSEPLSLHHQALITQALARFQRDQGEHCLSDHSFANFYLFRQAHQYRFVDGEWPCLTGVSYDGQACVWPLFDVTQMPWDRLQTWCRQLNLPQSVLFPLSASQVQGWGHLGAGCEAHRNDADYVYAADQFRHYQGSVLNKKRNLVRQLLSAHTLTVQAYDHSCASGAQAVLADWMRAKGKATGEADQGPCLEALQLYAQLGLHGFFYQADGQAAGFVLAESLAPGVWVMRFAKGMDHLKGIYQYMFQQVCQAHPNLHWLNFEQDLGVENLRQTKLSYQPTHLLAKYRLRLSQLLADSLVRNP